MRIELEEGKILYSAEGRLFTKSEDGSILEWVPKEKIDREYFQAILKDNNIVE